MQCISLVYHILAHLFYPKLVSSFLLCLGMWNYLMPGDFCHCLDPPRTTLVSTAFFVFCLFSRIYHFAFNCAQAASLVAWLYPCESLPLSLSHSECDCECECNCRVFVVLIIALADTLRSILKVFAFRCSAAAFNCWCMPL